MSAESIFTKIINGQIPCHRVFENEHVIAFLDINPLADGHTLVIPKRQVERLEQLPADEAAELGRVLGEIAARVLKAVNASDYNVLQNNGRAAGQEVPHVHFHIIPRRAGDSLGYRWNAKPGEHAQLAALSAKVSSE